MTKFINAENIEMARKERKETVLTHVLLERGWRQLTVKPSDYEKIVYLGKCEIDGDMFAWKTALKTILILKGIKGDEFND